MELDLRKQRILQAIVQDYVTTAEPVGSQVLVERYSLGVKSATIRNEMAEMSERGYLRQPHTSAGRVPSDRGYRFYVNRLMSLPMVQEAESAYAQTALATASSELESILRRTCQLLTEMTQLPAVATPPDADETELRQIFVTSCGPHGALMVLLFSTGRAEHRLLNIGLTATDAVLLSNALTARWGRALLSTLRTVDAAQEPVPAELAHLLNAWALLGGEIATAARQLGSGGPMFIEGTHAVLNHPEFRDVERLSQFLRMIQERAALIEMLGKALTGAERHASTVQVSIGEETGYHELAEYSVVSSPYFIGDRERGTIGVLGPTRMDYGRASAAVDLMARTVGGLLTQISFSAS